MKTVIDITARGTDLLNVPTEYMSNDARTNQNNLKAFMANKAKDDDRFFVPLAIEESLIRKGYLYVLELREARTLRLTSKFIKEVNAFDDAISVLGKYDEKAIEKFEEAFRDYADTPFSNARDLCNTILNNRNTLKKDGSWTEGKELEPFGEFDEDIQDWYGNEQEIIENEIFEPMIKAGYLTIIK